MRIYLAQINPIIGDLIGNRKLLSAALKKAVQQGASLVVFPELALTGYPPEDLLLLPHFIEEALRQLQLFAEECVECAAIVGVPRLSTHGSEKHLFNSAAVIEKGKILGFQDKCLLPTYDVFDERRYFEPGERATLWQIGGKKVAVTICEDIWQHSQSVQETSYRCDPVEYLRGAAADFVVNLSASPYSFDKLEERISVCSSVARTLECPVLFCNQVGANDHLVFDGYSFVVNHNGELAQVAAGFEEDGLLVEEELPTRTSFSRDLLADLYRALVLGVRDYFHKSGWKRACIGLSGGIDSAVVAAIAAEALGPDSLLGVLLPSRYSSEGSVVDAEVLAHNLGVPIHELSIDGSFQNLLDLLEPHFAGRPPDVTEENLQARVRGIVLMAFSNKLGCLLLNTSNKSELAMGYSTLYGDSCGALGVLSDVTKQQVYALADYINREKEKIPHNTIQKPPSAELRPDQRDQDALPPYERIDRVLARYVEQHQSPEQIAEENGYPLEEVETMIEKIHQNEYKRRQFCLGLRVSEKAFTFGRRFPVVQKFVHSKADK